MVELYVNETSVDLAPGSKAEMVIKNPFFVTRFSKQDYSYPFSISANAQMRKLFGHIHNRESRLLKNEYDCVLALGSVSRKGTLKITDFDNGEYRAHVYLRSFSLSSLNKPLNELSRPLTGNLATQWGNGINEVWPSTPVYFPTIYNAAFYDPLDTDESDKSEPDFTGIVNGYSNGFLWNVINSSGEAENKYAASPMPAVMEVLKLGVEAAGYTLAGDVLNNEDLAKAWLFSNRGLDLINTDDALTTTAENLNSYVYELASSPILNFIDASSSLFNTSTNMYLVSGTWRGILRVSVAVTFSTPFGSVSQMRIRMLENGVFPPGGRQSVSTGTAGTLTLEFDQVIDSGNFNDQWSFQLFDPNSTVDIQIDAINAEFKYVDGESKLIRFDDPTDLKDYLPAIKFEDFINGLFDLMQLVAVPDERNKLLYVNQRMDVASFKRTQDLNDLPFKKGAGSLSPINEKQLVRYKELDNDDTVFLGTNLKEVWVYEDHTWSRYEKEPDDFGGEKIEIGLAPIFGAYTIIDFPFLNGNLDTLRIDHQANVPQNQRNIAIEGLSVALFEGQNGAGVCPADYKTTDLDFSLDKDLATSVLRAFINFKAWQESRSRKQDVVFNQLTRLPEADEGLVWNYQLWVWEEMRVTFSNTKGSTVELTLL